MKQKDGCLSIAVLCAGAVLAKYLIVLPEYMVKYNANAAWITALLKNLVAFLFLFIIIRLYAPFEGLSLEAVASLALGGFGRTLLNISYAAGFMLFNAALFRILIEALKTVNHLGAAYEYYALFIAAAVVCAAFIGIKSVTNISAVVFPLIVLSIALISIIMIPHYRLYNIMPFFGSGISEIGRSLTSRLFGYSEYSLLFFLAPHIGKNRSLRKAAAISVGTVTFFSVGFTLLYCLSVPYPASKTFFLPLYQISRMIKSGSFLERLEPLIVFVWTALILCSLSALMTVITSLMNNGREKGRSAFVPISVMIMFFLSTLPKTEPDAFSAYDFMLKFGGIPFPLIPLAVILIARAKKAGRQTA